MPFYRFLKVLSDIILSGDLPLPTCNPRNHLISNRECKRLEGDIYRTLSIFNFYRLGWIFRDVMIFSNPYLEFLGSLGSNKNPLFKP